MLIKKSSQRIKSKPEENQREDVKEVVSAEQSAVDAVQSDEQTQPPEENLAEKIFDIDNLDFSQRVERRTGTRRRGYRRIDDRKLVSRAKDEADNIKRTAFE